MNKGLYKKFEIGETVYVKGRITDMYVGENYENCSVEFETTDEAMTAVKGECTIMDYIPFTALQKADYVDCPINK